MKIKEAWKKFWHLLWEDQSLKGWIFSLVFLFIFIKLIFFPTLNFITGTTMPLAIVESCSMYHKPTIPFIYNFDNWWKSHEEKYTRLNITEQQFREFPLKNGFNKGDILFMTGVKPKNLEIGDIIIFNTNPESTKLTPIIHRIIKIQKTNNEYFFTTIGDNNEKSLTINNNPYKISEIKISENQLVAKAHLRIGPYLGWTKLIFYDWRNPVEERGLCKQN